ncbi:MAG: TrkA family potassium uptake protein [Clostridiales bacterium]|nr:TrkA family potassium uptake protein [Clostridiales bacterium]
MKSVLVIGAGKFGHHLAEYLCEMDNDVMLADKKESIINEYSDNVTTAEIGDFTVKSNLEALGVSDYDYVFVCVGDFQDSLVITDYLKELGAGFVIAKATSPIHEKFLLKNGADRVVYPERDYAYRMAVEYNNSSIFDFFQLNDETGIFEISPPRSWAGKTLAKINVRKIHGISVIAYRAGDKIIPINSPDYVFSEREHIIVMGNKNDINKIAR